MKNIHLIIAIIISLQFNILFAQKNPSRNIAITLSGKITASKTNLPLPGASIYISDLKAGTTADENGNYTLRNISSGKYLIEVSFIGFASIVETIDLSLLSQKDFVLTPSLIE